MPLPFHVAVPVRELGPARTFYRDVLGCAEGRVDAGKPPRWVDFNLFGHQFVIHEIPGDDEASIAGRNPVDGDAVPVPHYGAVLEIPTWTALAERLKAAGVEFVIPPRTRFAGAPGEQRTMFLLDPSGNALEFKAFADIERQLFAT
ncbi:VOC family protein [Alienimonas chondri]|uniref:VOC domain-containing protein n=1 Tax=Alienimonas chondri TaxID=2681879 RepID=A0ABX1V7A4_9PLAN|nr:VOC family protein [Alienimonas chondri]NNJ24115.1 hypothetical protein [Alienimonas chondri]